MSVCVLHVVWGLQSVPEQSVTTHTPTQELLQCIEESCKFGFHETALGVIIDIRDSHKQKACLYRLRKGDASFPPNDTIIQRQTPKIKTKEWNGLW